MSLVDDYLHAVSLLLPKAQRDDIIAELRDTILSQIEDRETQIGRPLTEAETEALLREIGHPLVVAARYRDEPQHLVGPALYPYWAFAVKIAIVIQVALAAVVFLCRAIFAGDVGQALGQAIGSSIAGALTLVGVATIAAWLIERRRVRIDYLDNWRVRDLHLLRFAAWDSDWLGYVGSWGRHPSMRTCRPRPDSARADPSYAAGPSVAGASATASRGAGDDWHWQAPPMSPESAAVGRGLGWIAGGVVLILWWVGVLHFGFTADPADLNRIGLDAGSLARTDWASLKDGLFVGVLTLAVLIVCQGLALLAHPRGVRLQGLFDVVRACIVLALVAWLGFASPISDAISVSGFPDLVYRLEHLRIDHSHVAVAPLVTLFLILVAVGAGFQILDGLWKIAVGSWGGIAAPSRT